MGVVPTERTGLRSLIKGRDSLSECMPSSNRGNRRVREWRSVTLEAGWISAISEANSTECTVSFGSKMKADEKENIELAGLLPSLSGETLPFFANSDWGT